MKKAKRVAIKRAYEHEYNILAERMEATAVYFGKLLEFVEKYPHQKLEKEHEDNLLHARLYVYWKKNIFAVMYIKLSALKSAFMLVKKDGVDAWQHP